MRPHGDAVAYPLAFAPGRGNAGVPQIRKMPGKFRLRAALSRKVERPKACRVAEGLKELRQAELFGARHT